jgi:hypothetical protein
VDSLRWHVDHEVERTKSRGSAIRNVKNDLKQKLKEQDPCNHADIQAQLRILRAWAAHVDPSLGSKLRALFFG